MTIKKATPRKTTSLLKKYLKEVFDIEVRIRQKNYSGGNSIYCSYDLGINKEVVQDMFDNIEKGSFNSMEDLYEYNHDRNKPVIDGYELYDFEYSFVDREIPNSILLQIARKLVELDMHNKCLTEDLINEHSLYVRSTDYDSLYSSWSDFIYKFTEGLNLLNFNTQDEHLITISDIKWNNHKLEVFYRTGNDLKEYSAFDYTIKEYGKKKESTGEPIEAKGLLCKDYSDKSFVLYGDTYEVKDAIKALGGRFNKFLKDENGDKFAGWIFKMDDKEEVLSKLNINQ